MWQVLRSISDTLGVGFLSMQLIKLIGMTLSLVGPLKFVASVFEGLFPLIANFFKINLGITVNGLDVMAASIAISGTLIVASSVATKSAMNTKYFWRFFLIPYAFIVILFAIMVQIATPLVEIYQFGEDCRSEEVVDTSFYGSTCDEMGSQINFVLGPDEDALSTGEPVDEDGAMGFLFSLGYLIGILPLIAVIIFFFKRLSVNRLLKRVLIAGGSALGLALASAAYAAAFGG